MKLKVLFFLLLLSIVFAQNEIEPTNEVFSPDSGGWFGWSIASLDYDGNGTNDLIVGAPLLRDSSETRYRGAVYFFDGETDMSEPSIILRGHTESEQLGICIENAGDVNSDGWDDLLIGANVTSDVGSAYLFFCGPDFDGAYDIHTIGESHVDNYGYSSTGLGDINLDGHDDFMVGALYNDARGNRTGRSYIYYGGLDVDSIPDMIFTGLDSLDDFATSMDGRHDFNNDGSPDFIIGAVQAGSYRVNPGEAYCFFGGDLLDTLVDVFTRGENPTDFYGSTVAFIGDANDDGFDDFAVGSYNNYTAAEDAGRVYIYYGAEEHGSDPDMIISGRYDENIGAELASAGDINGDGYDDLAVSNDYPPEDYPDSGRGAVMIHLGGIELLPSASFYMAGEYPSDAFGWSMLATEDLTGDGIGDFVISAPRWHGRSGKVYLYEGWQPPIRSYSCEITIKTLALDNQVLIIGQDTSASAGFDYGFDIIRLPAVPGETDAGIFPNDSIVSHIEYLKRDYRNDSKNSIIWQIDANSNGFSTIEWSNEILPEGIFLLENLIDMKSNDATVFNSPRELDIQFLWTPPDFAIIALSPGWNLISLPGYPVNYYTDETLGRDTWFFDTEDNIYYHPTRIQTGYGAFMFSPDSVERSIALFNHREPFNRLLQRGWNIIAAPPDTIAATLLSTSPIGAIVPGTIFGYRSESSTYSPVDTLIPGKGYFVLVAEACTLSIEGGSLLKRQKLQKHIVTIDEFGSTPPTAPFNYEDDQVNIISNSEIAIFPNPCNDYIEINTECDFIEVFDIEGKLVYLGKSNNHINTANWLPGVYNIRIHRNDIVMGKSLLVIH